MCVFLFVHESGSVCVVCVCVCVCVCVHVYVCASGSAVLAGCNYLKCKYWDALVVVVANGL